MSLIKFLSTSGQLLFNPYINRLKLGEGGLVAMNIAHSIAANKEIKITAIESVISFIVMCVLYGYNDYTDCKKDKLNPKKDIQFISLISENRIFFIRLIVVVQVITVVFTYVFLGWLIGVFLMVLFATNFIYSNKIKNVPLADILIVSVWGAFYVCLAGNLNLNMALMAGLMTGIAHFFQVVTDKEIDAQNNIVTSAVSFKENVYFVLLLLCIALIIILWFITKSVGIIFWGAVPFLVYLFSRRVALSWYVSRIIFFLLWLAILKFIYAGS